MAVQQNKKSPSRRGMHRSHDALTAPALSVDSATGEVHRPHHISANGMYRGRKYRAAKKTGVSGSLKQPLCLLVALCLVALCLVALCSTAVYNLPSRR